MAAAECNARGLAALPENPKGAVSAISELFQKLGTPVLLIDTRAHVVGANQLAHDALGTELQTVNGRLTSHDPSTKAALCRLLSIFANRECSAALDAVSVKRSRSTIRLSRGEQLGMVLHAGVADRRGVINRKKVSVSSGGCCAIGRHSGSPGHLDRWRKGPDGSWCSRDATVARWGTAAAEDLVAL